MGARRASYADRGIRSIKDDGSLHLTAPSDQVVDAGGARRHPRGSSARPRRGSARRLYVTLTSTSDIDTEVAFRGDPATDQAHVTSTSTGVPPVVLRLRDG